MGDETAPFGVTGIASQRAEGERGGRGRAVARIMERANQGIGAAREGDIAPAPRRDRLIIGDGVADDVSEWRGDTRLIG